MSADDLDESVYEQRRKDVKDQYRTAVDDFYVDAQKNNKCICEGNWRLILSEVHHLIGRRFIDHQGAVYTFYGVVHGDDDYYYGMYREGNCRLLSCVGSIEGHGYTLDENTSDSDD